MRTFLLILLAACPLASAAENILFPPNSGIINVKQSPYNAKGDGRTDDTLAIIKAIEENIGHYANRTLYFPNGTYIISDTLVWKNGKGEWKSYLSLQGQSRDRTTIKLKEGAAGFGNPDNPKALVYTASMFYSTSADPNNVGAGNEAFHNYIQNLTIDVGNNPGAIGIDYLANNIGAIRNVRITGNGLVGLSMQRYGPGPCLIKWVEIDGFKYGIKSAQLDYGITFEHLTLKNQKVVGVYNSGNVLSMRAITSYNTVSVIDNAHSNGLVVLVDGDFNGGSNQEAAIRNKGGLYVRNIDARGYRATIEHNHTDLPGRMVKEYATNASGDLPPYETALALPIEETPVLPEDPLSQWANVLDYGADNDERYNDDTQAIQDAVDSGKSTVFLPTGFYLIKRPIIIRGHARRVIGKGARISVAWKNEFTDPNERKGIFEVRDGENDTLEISGINHWDAFSDPAQPAYYAVGINHSGERRLVVKDFSWKIYQSSSVSGPVFFENVSMGYIRLTHPQKVWARQLNLESAETKIVNRGANLWILGLKTERVSVVIDMREGAKTELLGGLLYPLRSVDAEMPAFSSVESSYSLSYATTSYVEGRDYTVHVKERVNGNLHKLNRTDVSRRGLGSNLPLVVATDASQPSRVPAKPKGVRILSHW